VILELLHPQVARRDCNHCQLYQYNEDTGRVEQWRGRPLRRVRGQPPPCRTPQGCPKGSPEESRQLTRRNEQAYDHYLQCRATGRFPDDPLVARNAAIIRSAWDLLERRNAEELRMLLSALIGRRLW
jgi:hypothetical protein